MGIMFGMSNIMKGIHIHNHEYKIIKYADDTAILLDGSEKSPKSAFDLLHQFFKYSGLKPNIVKTTAVWIGSNKEVWTDSVRHTI